MDAAAIEIDFVSPLTIEKTLASFIGLKLPSTKIDVGCEDKFLIALFIASNDAFKIFNLSISSTLASPIEKIEFV